MAWVAAYVLGAVVFVPLMANRVWAWWRDEFRLTGTKREAMGATVFLSLYWPLVVVGLVVRWALRIVLDLLVRVLLEAR